MTNQIVSHNSCYPINDETFNRDHFIIFTTTSMPFKRDSVYTVCNFTTILNNSPFERRLYSSLTDSFCRCSQEVLQANDPVHCAMLSTSTKSLCSTVKVQWRCQVYSENQGNQDYQDINKSDRLSQKEEMGWRFLRKSMCINCSKVDCTVLFPVFSELSKWLCVTHAFFPKKLDAHHDTSQEKEEELHCLFLIQLKSLSERRTPKMKQLTWDDRYLLCPRWWR